MLVIFKFRKTLKLSVDSKINLKVHQPKESTKTRTRIIFTRHDGVLQTEIEQQQQIRYGVGG